MKIHISMKFSYFSVPDLKIINLVLEFTMFRAKCRKHDLAHEFTKNMFDVKVFSVPGLFCSGTQFLWKLCQNPSRIALALQVF